MTNPEPLSDQCLPPVRVQGRARLAGQIAVIALLALSAMVIIVARNARGPGWLSNNLDPDYCYLLNALNFATFHTAGHYDHPGTPVQVIGAIVVRMAHLFGNNGQTIARDVCERPEYFLAWMYAGFFALFFCALAVATVRTFMATGSAQATLPLAALVLASPTILVESTRVSPEPVLFFCAMFLQIVLLSAARSKTVGNRDLVLLAAVVGFGCAVKVTFLPLTLVPLFLLGGWRRRTVFCAGSALFFIVFTLPIAVHYRAIGRWFLNIFWHTGRYGYGAEGVIVPSEYLATLLRLLLSEPLLVAGIGCGGVYVAAVMALKKLRAVGISTHTRIIAGAVAAQIGQLLLVAKHPDPRYLVPGLCCSAFTIAGVIAQLSAGGKTQRRVATAVTVLFILLLVGNVIPVKKAIDNLALQRSEGMALSTLAGKDTTATVVYSYSASSLPYAVFFGNSYANRRYSGLLTGLYRNAFFYNPWHDSYESWEEKVTLEDCIRQGKPVYFQGYSFSGYYTPAGGKKPDAGLETVAEKRLEALYRLEPVIADTALQE